MADVTEDLRNMNKVKFYPSDTAFGAVQDMGRHRFKMVHLPQIIKSNQEEVIKQIPEIKYIVNNRGDTTPEALEIHKNNGDIKAALNNIRVRRYTDNKFKDSINATYEKLHSESKKLETIITKEHGNFSIFDTINDGSALAGANDAIKRRVDDINNLINDVEATNKWAVELQKSVREGKIPPPPLAKSADKAKEMMDDRITLLTGGKDSKGKEIVGDKEIVTGIIDTYETRITNKVNTYISNKKTNISKHVSNGLITKETAKEINDQLDDLSKNQKKYISDSKKAMLDELATWQKSLDKAKMSMDLTEDKDLANKALGELTQVEVNLGEFTNTYPNVEKLITENFKTMDASIQNGKPLDRATFNALLNKFVILPQTAANTAAGVATTTLPPAPKFDNITEAKAEAEIIHDEFIQASDKLKTSINAGYDKQKASWLRSSEYIATKINLQLIGATTQEEKDQYSALKTTSDDNIDRHIEAIEKDKGYTDKEIRNLTSLSNATYEYIVESNDIDAINDWIQRQSNQLLELKEIRNPAASSIRQRDFDRDLSKISSAIGSGKALPQLDQTLPTTAQILQKMTKTAPAVAAATAIGTTASSTVTKDQLEDKLKGEAYNIIVEIDGNFGEIDKNSSTANGMVGSAAWYVGQIDELKTDTKNDDSLSKTKKDHIIERLNKLSSAIKSRGMTMNNHRDSIEDLATKAKEAKEIKDEELKALKEQLEAASNKEEVDKIVEKLKAINTEIGDKYTKKTSDILKKISKLHKENVKSLNGNPDYNLKFGDAAKFNKAIDAIGGKHGLLQIFSQTANGSSVGSVAGGYLDMFTGALGGAWDGWEDMKKNATSDKERFWYNLVETGGIIGIGIIALNKLENWGVISHGVKLAMLAVFIGWALHNSGNIGQEMANWDSAKKDMNQRGTSVYNPDKVKEAFAQTSSGGKNIPSGATSTPITNVSTGKISNFNFAFKNGQVVTTNHSGAIIPNASNNSTMAKAGSISANGSFIPKDILGSNTIDLTKNSNDAELETFKKMLGNLDPANNPNFAATGTTGI